MTWAPLESQKSIYKILALDATLISLLGAVTEVQRLTFSSTPDTGSFVLNYKGVATAAIDGATLTASTIQSALRLIEGLEEIIVAQFSINVFDVTLNGIAGNAPLMTVTNNSLQDVDPKAVTIVVTERVKGVQKVFDEVPDNVEYPYLTLQILPWTDRGSHTLEGLQCELQINTWYREPGRGNLQVQTIQKRIDELLHKMDICIDGWNVVGLRRTFIDILKDSDNVTKQGIQRFNLLTGEA